MTRNTEQQPFPELLPEDEATLPDGTAVRILEVIEERADVLGVRLRLLATGQELEGALIKARVATVRRGNELIWSNACPPPS
jgi:hypothetical protein